MEIFEGTLRYGGDYRPTIELYEQTFILSDADFEMIHDSVISSTNPFEEDPSLQGRFRMKVFLSKEIVHLVASKCQDATLVPWCGVGPCHKCGRINVHLKHDGGLTLHSNSSGIVCK